MRWAIARFQGMELRIPINKTLWPASLDYPKPGGKEVSHFIQRTNQVRRFADPDRRIYPAIVAKTNSTNQPYFAVREQTNS